MISEFGLKSIIVKFVDCWTYCSTRGPSINVQSYVRDVYRCIYLSGKRFVRSLISIRDKTNLEYISGCKSYFTNRFYRVQLGLKFTSYHYIKEHHEPVVLHRMVCNANLCKIQSPYFYRDFKLQLQFLILQEIVDKCD